MALAFRCAADCVPGSAQLIDDMMSGSTQTKLDARALLFVVDLVLRRGLRQNPPPDRNAKVMAKVIVPHLSKWLRVLLLTKRSPEQLEKTRKMISRWSDDGYLPMGWCSPPDRADGWRFASCFRRLPTIPAVSGLLAVNSLCRPHPSARMRPESFVLMQARLCLRPTPSSLHRRKVARLRCRSLGLPRSACGASPARSSRPLPPSHEAEAEAKPS